jgi:hypothetical protein
MSLIIHKDFQQAQPTTYKTKPLQIKNKNSKLTLCNKLLWCVKRGSMKSDRILGFVSSNSVWRRSIMGCMELHGSSFELCIGMGMAASIDEVL